MKKKLIIFASGSKDGGGSGFANLVNASKNGVLNAEIIGVISNHEHGGVRQKADLLGIPFILFAGPYTKENYQAITAEADFVALSGWLKLVTGLDPRKTINIHPGPLPRFGGKGMYGHHVHEAVVEAYKRGEILNSAVTMHFVTEKYDEGPVFFQVPVEILPSDDAISLGARVLKAEQTFQPIITNAVIEGRISWDGTNSGSLVTLDQTKITPAN